MRTIPIAVAAVALLSVSASAQMTPARDNPASPGPNAATAQTHATAATINPLAQDDVSEIEGTSVYGGDDGKIGHISTALMNPQTKQIDRLVVAAGGVLGVGAHRVAIPVDQFTWDADRGAFRLQTTLASLKEMPEWGDNNTMTGSSQPHQTEPPQSHPAPANAGGDNADSNNNPIIPPAR